MSKDNIVFKECYVRLEPCTPKAQIALSAELRNVIQERNILTARSKKKLFSALDEINLSNQDKRREQRKNQALQEILDSEVKYLNQLEIIMNYFMKPIKEKNIISSNDYEILFGSIKNIYKVNGELLNELKDNLTNVASAFTKLAPFFKMYSVYAYDYKKSLDTMERLYSTNVGFLKILSNQESRPEVQAKLTSLLITPIQRIPRYCMLLRQVLDNTLPSDLDYNVLKDSLEKLEEVARHVNSLVEERENSQRLLELLRCLKNDKNLVIQPGRKLIKEGILYMVEKEKSKDKIYLILMSDIIMCCKIKKNNIQSPNSLKCLHIYPLNKCNITQNNTTKMFEIVCQNESIILYHESGTESDEWIKTIKNSIQKCLKNRLTLRKGSSSRRPATTNFGQYVDAGVSPGISRIRKRKLSDEDENVTVQKKVAANSTTTSHLINCFPLRRKSINSLSSPLNKDSLYPMRAQIEPKEESKLQLEQCDPDVFIFGNENQNRGFTFKFFSSIVNSVKKVFGFKN